ncbi:MAG: TIGR00730 family Rossman fold protein, partial [bacterium]
LADAARAAGGEVIGVLPDLFDRKVAHTGLSEMRLVRSMHERKAEMERLSDGFIALPGGWGTLEEIFEAITWAQLGLHRKPCGLLNVSGYFDGLLAFLDHAVAQGFIKSKHRLLRDPAGPAGNMLVTAADPAALLRLMETSGGPSAE